MWCLTQGTRKIGMTLSLKTLISSEDKDLNLHNNLTLVHCAFPGNPLTAPPHTQYLLSSAEDGI